MITISIATLFPNLFDQFLKTSIIKKAQEKGFFKFNIENILDITEKKVRVDGPTSGPGDGMILKPEVIEKAIQNAEEKFGPAFKIFFSPQGDVLDQKILNDLKNKFFSKTESKELVEKKELKKNHIVLICSRYEGIDNRVEEYYSDLSLSIGDYVLLGGDLPAQVFLEGLVRLFPGVLSSSASFENESFQSCLLDFPEYSKPNVWKNKKIPDVILSGNHKEIDSWRKKEALKKTVFNRFDWFRSHQDSSEFKTQALNEIPSHYAAVMYDDVLFKDGSVGQTSIKSMDIHDISRSASTYGIKKLFIITPLKDQQEIAKEFLGFWLDGKGLNYNKTRFEAVSKVCVVNNFKEALDQIEKIENSKPLIVSTSAKNHPGKTITYSDHKKVFKEKRPVFIIFGTGYGLSRKIIEKSDFILMPLSGLVDYNHLSVRAAASIIFDRWLGLNQKNIDCKNEEI